MHAILGYLIADLSVRLLPAFLTDRAATWVARAVFALRPPARRAAERNLHRLSPGLPAESRRWLARRTFEHFALALLDFLRLAHRPASSAAAVEVLGQRHLDEALAGGRGVILLSAHLGHWERGAAFVAQAGARLSVIARPHPNRWVDRFFRRRRSGLGVVTLEERPVWARAAERLRRGEWVALLGDRVPEGARSSVCAWVAAVARRTGAIVLPAAMVRIAPRRYAACFGAPLSADQCSADGYREAMRPLLQRYPSQWCAFESLPAEWT